MGDDRITPFAQVKVEGIYLTSSVSSVEIEDNDRLIDKATIVLDDPDAATADVLREQQTVEVDLGWVSEHAVLFEGVVTRVRAEAVGSGRQRVFVTAYDLSYKLMQGPPRTAHHVGKLSSILQAIVTQKAYGFTVGQVVPDPDPEFTADAPLRQTNRRDWEFVQELGSRYGARCFVEHNEGSSKFYFVPDARLLQGDPMGTLTYASGDRSLAEFRYQRVASAAAASRTAVIVDPSTGDFLSRSPDPLDPLPAVAGDATTRDRLAGTSRGAASAYDTAVDLAGKAAGKADEQLPQQVAAGLPSDGDRAEALARRDPTRVMGLVGEGIATGTVKLRAKGKVTIHGIATWAAGDWYVRRVHHVFTRASAGIEPATYRTRFVATR